MQFDENINHDLQSKATNVFAALLFAVITLIIALGVLILIGIVTDSFVIVGLLVLIVLIVLLLLRLANEVKKQQTIIINLERQLQIASENIGESASPKADIISTIAHELLTPIAAIKGYLSTILDAKVGQISNDEMRQTISRAFDITNRLSVLVTNLHDVSQTNQRRPDLNKQAFDLGKHVEKAVDELRVAANAKSLDLTFVQATQALPQAYADPDQIYRVLINLISNAIKYTSSGWVRCYISHHNDNQLLFSVADSGVGIPPQSRGRVFEKFYRGQQDETEIQGDGLGLAISYNIINSMNGRIWLESEVGKGTVFYFSLPISSQSESRSYE